MACDSHTRYAHRDAVNIVRMSNAGERAPTRGYTNAPPREAKASAKDLRAPMEFQ